jgi:hypothetical protein
VPRPRSKRRQPQYLPDGKRAYEPSWSAQDQLDEQATIEEDLLLSGWLPPEMFDGWGGMDFDTCLHFEAQRIYSRRFTYDKYERWGDWQRRVVFPKQEAQAAAARAEREARTLTPEEWAFLAEHFDGANDPTAQSVHAKALLNLKQLEHTVAT